jgi:type III restriction enzyme
MGKQVHFKFDPHQGYQLDAIQSVADLFDDLSRFDPGFALGGEIVPNLPPGEMLYEATLLENLNAVQERHKLPLSPVLAKDSGLVLDGAGTESWDFPSFTIEMETGTGKTYVYLRTIYELHQRYGFTKFIIIVPSIAIYEGVQAAERAMRAHFASLYGSLRVNLTAYEGRLQRIRSFAQASAPEILLMTVDSFNKISNVIYRPTDKIQGSELLPYQFLQETRPIVILDEPQSIDTTEKAKSSIRTLHPLFGLRYSATHRESPNLVYRLTPIEAFRQNLVKKIQVIGLSEQSSLNEKFLALESLSGTGSSIRASVRTVVQERTGPVERVVTLKQWDNLFDKTRREEHRDGYTVEEISVHEGGQFVRFSNERYLTAGDVVAPLRPEVFRAQIEETIRQHFDMQARLKPLGIKVLSLFFIDKVANYTAREGAIIRELFDELFERLKGRSEHFAGRQAAEVRKGHFAKKKAPNGDLVDSDTDGRNKEDLKAERDAFNLIMREKETLLSFDEPVSFIFAHSALKEGWDNPNVFQICTLNQTVSEIKKRQEIGRGLRLAVNQNGERVFDDDVNLLTVVANESYEVYARKLQGEYTEAEGGAPPTPKKPQQNKVTRRDEHFYSETFKQFWRKLNRRAKYRIEVDTPALIGECVEKLSEAAFPEPVIVLTKGRFVVTEYTIKLESVSNGKAVITVEVQDTNGRKDVRTLPPLGATDSRRDLGTILREDRLRGYKILEVTGSREDDNERVKFGNEQELTRYLPLYLKSEHGQQAEKQEALELTKQYPVFDLIGRAAKETGLTRPTLTRIFAGMPDKAKTTIFKNPEGFAGVFVSTIKETLARHVAERIEFTIETGAPPFDEEELFPPTARLAQKELTDAGARGLYDQVQYDSTVELDFITKRLRREEDAVLLYFKFPPKFRLEFPRVIGNYNPDWGIVRVGEDGRTKLELVRETKGRTNLEQLRFASEGLKIRCAQKFFASLGIDYRTIDGTEARWWLPAGTPDEKPLF